MQIAVMKRSPALILISIALFTGCTYAQPNAIRLNQLGFYPGAPKIAVVTGEIPATRFFILSYGKNDTVCRGQLSEQLQSANSSVKTRIADFSSLKRRGVYVLYVPGLPVSYSFHIGYHAANQVALASLKAFYYQRVSMPLEANYAGKWARLAGHPDTAVFIHPSAAAVDRPAGTVISCPGGWYDAGDYNKYIVNSGITMGTLLSAYEDFPSYFDTLNTHIPESNDKIPDILNEIIYNLRWMLTMQDPSDGGVYNKCTNAAFDGMVMPGVTKQPRYVVQKGVAATLDFAAVTAQAARILQKLGAQLPGLGDSCAKASQYAWQWALQNPSMAYDQNVMNARFEPKITTGAYGDRVFTDEWFWAACELYCTTKDEQYYKTISERINDTVRLPAWPDVFALGYYTLLRMSKSLPALHKDDIALIRQKVITLADAYLQQVNSNAFRVVMGGSRRDFNWGSNSNAANQSVLLINAWRATKNKKYIDNALTNLDYILGRNATGYCFVTGIGSRRTMRPHHRPSVADGIDEPVPGLMAGGPNPARQDGCHYDFTEPETAYADDSCSYASNEIAINWNAPLVYVANAIEALQYVVGYAER